MPSGKTKRMIIVQSMWVAEQNLFMPVKYNCFSFFFSTHLKLSQHKNMLGKSVSWDY